MSATAGLAPRASAAWAQAWVRLLNISRYPGQIALEILMPILFATMPMLLARATGSGAAAATNFAANTGTRNYVAYLLIGSNVFILVTRAFWDVAYWLRYEQSTGTLETVSMAPVDKLTLAAGVALYSTVRSLLAGTAAYTIGCLLFGVNPLQGDVLLAGAFVLLGLVPLYGLSLLFGALVLRFKETNSLVNLLQWGASFLMGVYYPVTVLPRFLRAAAMLFPPTWVIQGARAAMLGLAYYLGHWYLDLAVLGVFLVAFPLLGAWVFRATERGLRRKAGIGDF
jgi:ABC-2 type transport system permease protein